MGLARALGTMVRLDCLAAQNAHLPHAFAMFKRCAPAPLPNCTGRGALSCRRES